MSAFSCSSLLPHRDAAAGDDGVTFRQQLLHLACDLLRVVRAVPLPDAEAQLPQPGGVLDAVGVVDLAGRPSFARGQKLAAGGQNAHGERFADRHSGIALPGQHPEVGRGEDGARPGDDSPGGDVPAPEHHVLLRLQGGIEPDGVLTAVGQLLHQDAVRPLGQGRTGHDAGCTACGQGRGGGISGVELHDYRQGDGSFAAGPGGVGAVQGVAVEGAAVKGRLVHPGRQGLDGDAADRIVQR